MYPVVGLCTSRTITHPCPRLSCPECPRSVPYHGNQAAPRWLPGWGEFTIPPSDATRTAGVGRGHHTLPIIGVPRQEARPSPYLALCSAPLRLFSLICASRAHTGTAALCCTRSAALHYCVAPVRRLCNILAPASRLCSIDRAPRALLPCARAGRPDSSRRTRPESPARDGIHGALGFHCAIRRVPSGLPSPGGGRRRTRPGAASAATPVNREVAAHDRLHFSSSTRLLTGRDRERFGARCHERVASLN